MIFYFSGCGNSRHVAETIAAGLNDSLTFIPEAAREGRYNYTFSEDESLGFVFPVYAWAPPKLVLDFIEKLTIKIDPSTGSETLPYVYFACTMGDECGLTEKIIRKTLEQKGWLLSSCFSVQMPETYIGMPGFKLDTEKNAQLKIDKADDTMMRIIPRLLNKKCFSEMTLGSFAWLKSRLVSPGFNLFATDDRKYHVDMKQCISCGQCMEVCPLQNIKMPQGNPVWQGNCTMCMACYHHCPVNAIQYGKATEGKGQYYYLSK